MNGRLRLAGALGTLVLLSACAAPYTSTPLPTRTPGPAVDSETAKGCTHPEQTFDPIPLPEPGQMPAGSTMAKFADRGRLVVGVSSEALPLGYRNPTSGDIEGFEVDLAKALAKAMFGDENKVDLRVLSAENLQRSIDDGDVDLAVRQVSMTCDNWGRYALSAPYSASDLKFLAHDGSTENPDQLKGKKVCAPVGSGAMQKLVASKDRTAVAGRTDTDCLVQFQQGQVDAIAGDGAVLAGLAKQDPYAKLSSYDQGKNLLAVAARKDRVDLIRWTNAVLAKRAANGEWQGSYNKWVKPYAGDAQAPMAAYGRQ